MNTISYRQARDTLTEAGHGANQAQDILDDLAHWGPDKTFSVRTPDGVRWLRYGGLRLGTLQPVYNLGETS